MAGLPSHLFVVRHGNRLDAADKQWHLTSPTPYDPPLTYGGFLQARTTGNQIAHYLEQAKLDAESSSSASSSRTARRRRRFRVVIHCSPFLRCVQTSVAIASGLAQTARDSPFEPADIIVPAANPTAKPDGPFKSAMLRIDAFLGEWLSPEYFENITPPPGSSLMVGGAKAELLRREDYSMYTDAVAAPVAQARSSKALWNGSPTTGTPANGDADGMSSGGSPQTEEKKGYKPLRPTYAVSSTRKIPDGFVAHARDQCVTVDFQWDSMREPLDFGDGGRLGEEWTAMHIRFRRGLQKLVNWYATADSPAEMLSPQTKTTAVTATGAAEADQKPDSVEDEVQTVVIVVSHGAGCNALIGAITHQPVLMDIGIASITMAVRKPLVDYPQLLTTAKMLDSKVNGSEPPLVTVDQMYEIRLSASTEHLRSSASTPVSARSAAAANAWNPHARGRTSTLGSGPSLGAFTYSDPLSSPGSRSSSMSGALGIYTRRESGSQRSTPRVSALASIGLSSLSGNGIPGGSPPASTNSPNSGLWTPTPSSLRLMEDGSSSSQDGDDAFPNFDQFRFNMPTSEEKVSGSISESIETTQPTTILELPSMFLDLPSPDLPTRPMLSGPIKLQTDWTNDNIPEEVQMTPLGDPFGSLWGVPPPPDPAERFRDTTQSKRRWTVNEQSR